MRKDTLYLLCVLGLLLWPATVSADLNLSEDIASDESVYIFPTYAVLAERQWQIRLHSWIFEFEADSLLRRPIRAAVKLALGDAVNPQTQAIFDERMTWALVDNESGKHIRYRLPISVLTDASPPNGQVQLEGRLAIRDSIPVEPKWIPIETAPTRDGRVFRGRLLAVPPTGVSVISDIDDTIKDSNVLSKKELLRNSLARPFRAIEGLRTLYQKLQQRRVAFHYVSSSPRFLCPLLVRFFEKVGIPSGSLHLKQVRFADSSLFDLFKSSTKTKPSIIGQVLRDFPKRRFILVGDSGESDPEIYHSIAQQNDDQVAFILIRLVRGTASEKARLKTLFRDWPRNRWAMFEDHKTDVTSLFEQIWAQTKIRQKADH